MKHSNKGQRGFTLVELLIVVAILAVLAGVVIPSVLGLMGRGGAQAYDTDQKVIHLATATFFQDVHGGFNKGANPSTATWGDDNPTISKGHYYPTALGYVDKHELVVSTAGSDEDLNNRGSFVLKDAGNNTVLDDPAGNALIRAHAIWMGLLVNDDTAGVPGGTSNRGAAAPLAGETALYLQEIPDSASADNGSLDPGGYTWIVGKNGAVYGAYPNNGKWYAGYGGGYP